jgi:hypothetical protein
VLQKPHFGSFWHMRIFINAMLGLAIAGVLGGVVPVSARHLAELHSIRAEIAADQAARAPTLRPDILR